MVQTPPEIGRMASKHSWQTGSREILSSGVSQMRQLEGNNTAKRLSATSRAQARLMLPAPISLRSSGASSLREAIGVLTTAAWVWLARILSPLLLKTASVLPARNRSAAGGVAIARLISSITSAHPARQRYDRVAAQRLEPSSPLQAIDLSPA